MNRCSTSTCCSTGSKTCWPGSKAPDGHVIDSSLLSVKGWGGESMLWRRKRKDEAGPVDPNAPVVALEGVSRVYKGDADEATWALRDVSLEIGRGEYVCVSGPSGCGKSTLLSVLALLDSPSIGQYRLNGRATAGMSQAERARARTLDIGLVFQSFNLLGDLTVYENVEYPLTLRGMAIDERKAIV